MNSEVLIIGGGVIGLSIARELQKKGAERITIVDRGPIGREASWAAAGMLAPNIETDSDEDFHKFGIESLDLYPKFAAELLDETGIDIELDRSGTLCVAFSEDESIELHKTHARQQARHVSVELLSGEELRRLEPSISEDVRAALFYPNDWQVENRKLVAALREFAQRSGIRIVEDVEVSGLIAEKQNVVGARTSVGDFRSGTTIIATGAWTSLIKIGETTMPVSIRPIRGQMLSFLSRERLLRRVIYSHHGYLVPRSDGRILVGATVEDVGFDKTTSAEGIDSLRLAAVEILPQLANADIGETWAGLRPFADDGLPVLGEIPGWDNAVVATAHYRNGILLAPKTAEIVASRIIDGIESEFLKVFSVDRFETARASVV
jgi:glycine oxidase